MRTTTRIALGLMGTAIFVTAMATPGARAGRNAVDEHRIGALAGMTAPQCARQQARPDRIEYVQMREVASVATAIAHSSSAPEVANLKRGGATNEDQLALALTTNRSIAWADECTSDVFAAQQVNASDGGRRALSGSVEDASCSRESKPERRTRQAVIDDTEQMQVPQSEPTPFVIKFEAVININLAGLGW